MFSLCCFPFLLLLLFTCTCLFNLVLDFFQYSLTFLYSNDLKVKDSVSDHLQAKLWHSLYAVLKEEPLFRNKFLSLGFSNRWAEHTTRAKHGSLKFGQIPWRPLKGPGSSRVLDALSCLFWSISDTKPNKKIGARAFCAPRAPGSATALHARDQDKTVDYPLHASHCKCAEKQGILLRQDFIQYFCSDIMLIQSRCHLHVSAKQKTCLQPSDVFFFLVFVFASVLVCMFVLL